MNLKEQIEKYKPYNEQEEKDKQTMLKYIILTMIQIRIIYK